MVVRELLCIVVVWTVAFNLNSFGVWWPTLQVHPDKCKYTHAKEAFDILLKVRHKTPALSLSDLVLGTSKDGFMTQFLCTCNRLY